VEKVCAEFLVPLEIGQQHVVAARDIEVERGRDFAQVGDGLLDQAGGRLAFVDVKTAAVAQHHVEIMIAAEGVVPGEPVNDNRGFSGMPSDAAGPVVDIVTPTTISACAAVTARPSAIPANAVTSFMVSSYRLSC